MMQNVKIEYDGNWIPGGTYKWPADGSLHVYAYSPFCESAGPVGITSMPAGISTDSLTFDFTVAADIADQTDLLWAEPTDAHSSPCNLTFRHALTRVRFVAGDDLPPCTVSKIEVKNVYSKGKIDIKSGVWSDPEGLTAFSVEPDLSLEAEKGAEYVAPGTSLITDDDDDADEFFMLPQVLSADTRLCITIEKDGETIDLEAPAGGSVWREGKTVTYKLTTNPEQEGLKFAVEGDFNTPFTGGTVSFKVTSAYESNGTSTPVEWKAEFIDASGNVIDRPDWIKDFSAMGEASADCFYTTGVLIPEFKALSPQSKALRNARDINESSGHDPYNLSSSTGSTGVENTANCYIVNAPGRYSLPLVYGNAIKNSMPNTAAYTAQAGDGGTIRHFINHLGQPITDPYIYNNQGCVPDMASLEWEDRIGIIRDVQLSFDRRSITFEVPEEFIRQGNALLAIRDKGGNILWSWQIWVTDYNPDESYVNVTTDSGTRRMYAKSIGAVRGGDELSFPEEEAYVRFCQVNTPSGMTPRTVTIKIHQDGLLNTTVDYNTYYQWGRKDPIIADKKRWFDSSHNELNELSMKSVARNVPEGKTLVECMIGSPGKFWKIVPGYRYRYLNLWNSGAPGKASVKPVYDPSPVGAKVPEGELIRQLLKTSSLSWGTSGTTPGFFVSGPCVDGELFFTALGYRHRLTGLDQESGTKGEYWSSQATPDMQDAVCLSFNHGNCGAISTGDDDFRGRALGVRPVRE
ncbi:MAG: fimbrillin family protein, partial [Muribaculaceae bacterium]|nr:fimbrillin family protein [Muribaculaceae bacterium]